MVIVVLMWLVMDGSRRALGARVAGCLMELRQPAREIRLPRASWRCSLLGEADLPPLQGVVPEGGDDDELVANPLGGLGELHVERLSGRRGHGAVGQGQLPGEGPGGAGDKGDPVA